MRIISIILVLELAVKGGLLQAQYLRDKTQLLNSGGFYPKDASQVLGLYSPDQQYPITLKNVFHIPEIDVQFDNKVYPFFFDFGNSDNITLTNAIADSLRFTIVDTSYTYTADGKIRGQTYRVLIPGFKVLDQSFRNEEGFLTDWTIYATNPFNGLIGLKYLSDKCFTLSYQEKTLAISSKTIIPELSRENSVKIGLEHYDKHPYGVHFRGQINGRESIIYFDTGKSSSFVNADLVSAEKIVRDKSGAYFAGTVEVKFGTVALEIYCPRVRSIKRNIERKLPVGIEVGSDILKYFLLTIDRTDDRNILIIHR